MGVWVSPGTVRQVCGAVVKGMDQDAPPFGVGHPACGPTNGSKLTRNKLGHNAIPATLPGEQGNTGLRF